MKPVDGRVERGDKTASALLDAARRAFAEHGYDGASVRDIAQVAGQNPALIRYHYGGKDELYAAVVDESLNALGEAMQGELNTPGPDLARRLGERLHTFMAEHDDDLRIVTRALVQGEPRLVKAAKKRLAPLFANAQQTLQLLGPAQRVKIVDAIVTGLAAAMAGPLVRELYLSAAQGDERTLLDHRREHVGWLVTKLLEGIG